MWDRAFIRRTAVVTSLLTKATVLLVVCITMSQKAEKHQRMYENEQSTALDTLEMLGQRTFIISPS